MISMGASAARAVASAVLPMPVGPTMTGTIGLASPKPPLQLDARQLHDRGPAVHVVRRQRAGEQPADELFHLLLRQRMAGLDRRAAGERGREALDAVGQRAEASAR